MTEHCNLNCVMCYERNSPAYERKKHVLDFGRLSEVIDECAEFKPHYELFGGEPLMYPHFDQLLAHINRRGSQVTIPTNGTLLRRKADTLLGHSVDNVWVSLDGPPEVNDTQRGADSYQLARNGIVTLFEKRERLGLKYPRIGVHCVVTPFNYEHLNRLVGGADLFPYVDDFSFELQKYLTPKLYDRYLDYLSSAGTPVSEARYANGYVQEVAEFSTLDASSLSSSLADIQLKCVDNGKGFFTNPGELTPHNISEYFSAGWHNMTNHHKSCVFPFAYAEISASGDVTLCHSFYDDVLGNISSQNLLDIWSSPKAAAFRKSIKKRLIPICYACCSFFNPNNMA